MTDPPQNVVQAGTRVAEGVIGGLSSAPGMLVVVLLNMAMMAVGGYYLLRQEELRSLQQLRLTDLLQACISETVPLKAFDNPYDLPSEQRERGPR